MRSVHWSIAVLVVAFFVAAPQGVRGQETESCSRGVCGPCAKNQRENCLRGGKCLQGERSGKCPLGERCETCSQGEERSPQDCMIGRYGYGKAPGCEKAKEGEVCQVHGRGPCPEEQVDLGLGLRQALTPATQPSLGVRPLLQPRPQYPYGRHPYGQYGAMPPQAGVRPQGMPPHGGAHVQGAAIPPHGGMYPPAPAPQPRFPVLHSFFVQPPIYMTTAPEPPMPTYTTRGPRDFLHPNPPGIGH